MGSASLGPGGSISGVTVTGTITMQSSDIEVDPSPAWTPSTNPGGIPQNYTATKATTLPGGTYYFTSLTVNSTLEFSSPAILYINGDVDINATLQPTSLKPADLRIYQIGSHAFGDSKNNNVDVTAVIYAPQSALATKNKWSVRGAVVFDSITAKNTAEFFCDEGFGMGTGAGSVATLK